MNSFTMLIDGQCVPGDRFFPVINPATGEVFAEAPDCSFAQLDSAMEAAQRAFPAWQRDENARRQALRQCADVLRANVNMLGEILTREQGKPLNDAKQEVYWMADDFEAFSKVAIPCDVLQDDEELRIEVQRKPFGVIAAIVPWNFPLLMAGWKIEQSLITGNTIVLKPSPYTPLATLKAGELLSEVLPAGVLNVVSGGNELGAAMTAHPIPRKISFTGSIATGKKIALAAAADLKHITLEMGGNDPAIILPDISVEHFAEKIFWGAFWNSGQACIAIKRLYVHERIYPQMVTALAELARQVKMGDGFDPDTRLGPLNNRMQFERVIDLVEDAKGAGGQIVVGGKTLPGRGYFYEPTIVTDIDNGVRLVDEEQFGPALPIIPYRDVDDALERANATHFGLGGSIWTNDLDQGADLASQLECGNGWVNQHMALSADIQPLPGAKWSAIGYELGGKWGVDAYSRLQVVRVAK